MAPEPNYWNRFASTALSRRRLAKSALALAVSSAAIAAIGCGSDRGGQGGDRSRLLSEPSDTSGKAVKGGILERGINSDPNSFDFTAGSAAPDYSGHVYSRLMKYEAIKYPKPAVATVVPDAALSWETSADGLTYTYKLRPNFKFDPRPPTNGRALTTGDVLFSWNRFATQSSFRNTMVNSIDPSAPVLSVTAPDESTIVAKLAFPYAPFNIMFGYYRYGQIMPVEAAGGFDVRQEARGTGAWRLKAFVPSQRVEFERNPDWYDAQRVHLDGMRGNVLPEYTAALAQFRAGRLATYNVLAQDILPTKRSLPQLTLQTNPEFPVSASWIRYGYLPDSPFTDDRVRKALSMLLDRDLYIKTFGNTDEFEREGLPVPTRWNSPIPAGEEGYWIDPKNEKELGPGAKFFQHDPAEARKLLTAAGYARAVETKLTYTTTGAEAARQAEVLKAMWEDGGLFKISSQVVDFVSEFRPKYSQGSNKHEGIAFSGASGYPDIDGWLWIYYKSGSERSGHLDAGKVDAQMDDLITKQRIELDSQKRISIIKEFQRYAATKMYMLNDPGRATGFLLAQPWLGNFGAFRSRTESLPAVEGWTHYWIDTKAQQSS